MGLPHGVEDPALMRVGSADVGSARDDLCRLWSILVGYIVNCESVLVVAIADVSAVVALVRTSVDDTWVLESMKQTFQQDMQ